jgi:hypothetical protein
LIVVGAMVVVVSGASGLGASGYDCCDSARTLSRESDPEMTLELEVSDMQYTDLMLMHNPQVGRAKCQRPEATWLS